MIAKDSALFVVGIAGSVALAACGGAGEAGEAKAPAKAMEPESSTREPTSIQEAEEQIARARADLSLGDDAGRKAEGDKLDRESAVPSQSPGASSAPREEASRPAPGDSCSQSCRALSSMRRAVSALCRMTGDEDARCSGAKRTLEESESRVARCHCGT